MYYVPQVRAAVSTLRLPHIESETPLSSPGKRMLPESRIY